MSSAILLLLLAVAACGLALGMHLKYRNALKRMRSMEDEMHDARMELAEKTLNLMERTEILEEQKIRIGEANIQLLDLNERLREEKEHSERLLLNILPVSVANDLKMHGRTEPRTYDNVTVLFSDLVGFTQMSSTLDPITLIDELNGMFTAFDTIIERNGCERIKTIGDAYLALCGMPDENPRHAEAILDLAAEMLRFLHERNRDADIRWKIRIGVHSGPVVGGVVGIKKYIYDVFGDTINTASRMESHSEPMRINVSASTCGHARSTHRFVPRPPVDVKGKGLQTMYWLAIPGLSADD